MTMKTEKIEPKLRYKMYCPKNKDHKRFRGVGSVLTMWRCKICKIPVAWEEVGVAGRSYKPAIFFKERDNEKYGYR